MPGAMKRSITLAFALGVASSVPLLVFAPAAIAGHPNGEVNGAEAYLKRSFDAIEQHRLQAALDEIDRLVTAHPNFRLAHLIRGDLLLARTQPLKILGNTGHTARERLEELRAEARARARIYRDRPRADRFPRYLLQLDSAQRSVIVVDSSRSRLYLYENAGGAPHLVADYYTTLGKRGIVKNVEGDQKTPIGVYNVTSSIPGSKLPDLYGWGALPIDYPNEWDRMRGRTGYGIWLHGVPSDTYARAPLASDGCIALANPDIEDLAKRVQVGATPVIIAERIEWVALETRRAERDAFAQQLEAWLADWQSRDSGRYLAHYARDFRSGTMGLEAWRAHKQRVNAAKSWIKVSLSNLSVFRAPGAPAVIAVNFDQDYRSSNLAQKTRKRQYWVEEGGRWKIAYEAPVKRSAVTLPESFRKASR